MTAMTPLSEQTRRHDDGTIDVGHYRLTGARLRRQARTQLVVGLYRALLQIPAKALNAAARFLEIFCLGRVGNAESRSKAEGRALNHRNTFSF